MASEDRDFVDADLSVVLDAYRAFAAADIDAAVANLADGVIWLEPDEFPDGGLYIGRAAVAGYLARSRARWSQLVSTPTARRIGHTIAVRHHIEGEMLDGTHQNATVADIFTVHDGTVTRMQGFLDPDEAFPGD